MPGKKCKEEYKANIKSLMLEFSRLTDVKADFPERQAKAVELFRECDAFITQTAAAGEQSETEYITRLVRSFPPQNQVVMASHWAIRSQDILKAKPNNAAAQKSKRLAFDIINSAPGNITSYVPAMGDFFAREDLQREFEEYRESRVFQVIKDEETGRVRKPYIRQFGMN